MSKEYYADKTRLSASMCKALLRSPAYAYWQMHHPSPPTPQMDFGKAFHLYMERRDADQFLIDKESKTKATKGFKSLREEALEFDKIALLESEFGQILKMAYAIKEHPIGGELVNKITEHEKRIDWNIHLNGNIIACKSLIDGVFYEGKEKSIGCSLIA